MTVLCGGISGGHLWDPVDVRSGELGGTIRTFAPMLPMTAEDLGGITDLDGNPSWPLWRCSDCHATAACVALEGCVDEYF